MLGSICGGTDIIACFMGENSVLPVHRGEIQSAHLGCAIECWDEEGKSEWHKFEVSVVILYNICDDVGLLIHDCIARS